MNKTQKVYSLPLLKTLLKTHSQLTSQQIDIPIIQSLDINERYHYIYIMLGKLSKYARVLLVIFVIFLPFFGTLS
ncbi:hypothetical protein KBG31_01000 [Patescibacteria group bacterium]|nr:hypothetical protein [Patescibacteria group bacterium]